jgi:hypothetical protein
MPTTSSTPKSRAISPTARAKAVEDQHRAAGVVADRFDGEDRLVVVHPPAVGEGHRRATGPEVEKGVGVEGGDPLGGHGPEKLPHGDRAGVPGIHPTRQGVDEHGGLADRVHGGSGGVEGLVAHRATFRLVCEVLCADRGRHRT